MKNTCGECRHGHDTKPGGEKPPPNTVWCGQRKIAMGQHRQMSCFKPFPGVKVHHCADCKRARITTPSGGSLKLGNVWCERRREEIHKMRTMDCFE